MKRGFLFSMLMLLGLSYGCESNRILTPQEEWDLEQAKFKSLTPEQHLAEARKALGLEQISIDVLDNHAPYPLNAGFTSKELARWFDNAREHLGAVPNDHPQKTAVLELFAQAKTRESERARIKKELEKKEAIKRRAEPGPYPPEGLEPALLQAIKAVAHDPESISDVRVVSIVAHKAKAKTPEGVNYIQPCWKVRFAFRGRNGFGALRVSSGSLTWLHGRLWGEPEFD